MSSRLPNQAKQGEHKDYELNKARHGRIRLGVDRQKSNR